MNYDFIHKKTGKVLAPENYFKLPESERTMYEICNAELNYKHKVTGEVIEIQDYLALPENEKGNYVWRPLQMTCNNDTQEYEAPKKKKDKGGDFLMSGIIGAVTGSAILGGILGGDMLGGILGDSLDGDLMD